MYPTASQHNRVFTLGIGASADRHLVKGMARVGKGVPSFTTYGENIAGKVLKQLKQSLQPCVHDVQVSWAEGQSAGIESSQAPLRAPPVYDGSRLLLYKLWSNDGAVGENMTITAKTPEGNLNLDLKIGKDNFIEGDVIHKMFARKMIQELEENFEKKDPAEVKSIITELGLKYSLGTKYTAFIAVDEQTNIESGMKTRQVKNQVAYGYGQMQQWMRSAPIALSSTIRSGAPILGSIARSFKSSSSDDECEEESEEVEFGSASFSLECATMSSKVRKTNECKQGKFIVSSKVPKNNMDKIVALTSLQTAAGFFKADIIAEKIIGNKFEVFRKLCEEKKIDIKIWLTALIISYIEKSFPEEKDTWELIVEKARDWLGKTDILLMATQCLNTEI